MKLEPSSPEKLRAEKLLAEIGDGAFTLKGAGVHYPFDQLQYRATGINPDGSIALEIVKPEAAGGAAK